MQEMEQSVFGGEPDMIPGLLNQRGVSPEMVGSLFSAARAFYQVEPWTQLSNSDILAIQVRPQKQPYFVIVMGQGGEEFGLSVYKNWKQVEEFFTALHPFAPLPPGERHAFMFNKPPFVSIDDLDAIEKYGWELPEPFLIPTPSIYMTRKIKRPDAAMLRWYEAALRAIPNFVADHLKTNSDGTHPPIETDLEVETAEGRAQVNIRYPGGDLTALENRATPWMGFEDDDDDLYMLFKEEGMDESAAPLISIPLPFSDSALNTAQQIMYDAWEEPRPARRIALAKKALKKSPNCADAYVLLAAEDAKSLEESFALYQSGVEAGRRALGEDFLNNPGNIGHFWGILETRPFMRAMEGLASIQWELGLREEAERNFREMLRLNPGDNQGIRYMLLNLLMELGQDDQAGALLKEYPDDWSAESSYTTALLAFREKGDSPESRQALKKAVKMNRHVPAFITGKKQIPLVRSDFITLGESDEAADYAAEYLKYWRETPGAIEWLEKVSRKKK